MVDFIFIIYIYSDYRLILRMNRNGKFKILM